MADSTRTNGKPTIVRAVVKPNNQTKSDQFSLGNVAQHDAWQVPVLIPMLYLSAVPLAEYIARLRVSSFVMQIAGPLVLWVLSGFDSNAWNGTKVATSDGSGSLANSVLITSLFYSFVVFVGSVAVSITGQAAGHPAGYQNHGTVRSNHRFVHSRLVEPRKGKETLTGHHHRMVSAHTNLLETFPRRLTFSLTF